MTRKQALKFFKGIVHEAKDHGVVRFRRVPHLFDPVTSPTVGTPHTIEAAFNDRVNEVGFTWKPGTRKTIPVLAEMIVILSHEAGHAIDINSRSKSDRMHYIAAGSNARMRMTIAPCEKAAKTVYDGEVKAWEHARTMLTKLGWKDWALFNGIKDWALGTYAKQSEVVAAFEEHKKTCPDCQRLSVIADDPAKLEQLLHAQRFGSFLFG